jgi:hypothetical protein
MSKKIMQALSQDFIWRMRNWALANSGSEYGRIRAMDYGAVSTSGYRESAMPILTGEAHDTETCITAIPMRYQPAVRQFWCNEGRPLVWHATKLGRYGVDDTVFCAWVMRGHECMQGALAAAAERRRNGRCASALRRDGTTIIKS